MQSDTSVEKLSTDYVPTKSPSNPRLSELEVIIGRGMTHFVEVGSALLEIRQGKLYKPQYSTFEAYCQERWGFSRQHASDLISSSVVFFNLSTTVDKVPSSEWVT